MEEKGSEREDCQYIHVYLISICIYTSEKSLPSSSSIYNRIQENKTFPILIKLAASPPASIGFAPRGNLKKIKKNSGAAAVNFM